MKIYKIVLTLVILLTFTSTTNASLSSINIFNLIEIKFNNHNDTFSDEEKSDNLPIENVESNEEAEKEIIETIVEEKIEDPIYKISFINNKMYIYLSDLDFKISQNTLFVNWYKVDFDLYREKYYSNDNYNVYSIDENRISNYFFEWDNIIYFKNNKTYKNSLNYYYFHWDLFTFDWVYSRIVCNWDIDRIIFSNWYWEILYDKKDLWKYHNITMLNSYQDLDKWYYNAEIYCSNSVKDLYYIWNFSFNYNTMYDQATKYTSNWYFYDANQYESLVK